MAREIFTLVGRIRTEGIQTLRSGLKEIDKQATKVSRSINRFGKNVQTIGLNITKLTAPLAVAGAAVSKFVGGFDDALSTSMAIMGDFSEETRKALGDTAREVAKETTFSAKEAANAYYYLASAGLDAAQSMAVLPKVAKFAQAGNFDLATATDLLTDAQSALGLATDDVIENEQNLIQVSDVLVKANTLANASVEQFSTSLTNKAGAALRLLGKDVEEGVAVLAAYADQGVKGEEAGTQLSIVLRDLQKASINNEDAFKKLGVSVFDSNGEMRKIADILRDLEKVTEGQSDKTKKMTLSMLGFQEKSLSATMALIGLSGKIDDYESKLRKAGGTTDEVSKKQLQSFFKQLKIIRNQAVDLALSLSEDLLPILKQELIPFLEKVVSKVKDGIKYFKGLSDETKSNALKFTALAVAAGPVLFALGKVISSVTLLNGILKATIVIMSANPYIIAIAGLAAVAVGAVKTYQRYKTLNDEIEKNHELLREKLENKQREQIVGALQEIIYYYEKLNQAALEPVPAEEYQEAKKHVDALRGTLGGFGIELGHGATALRNARLKLLEYGVSNKDAVEFTENDAIPVTEKYTGAVVDLGDAFGDAEKAAKDLEDQRRKATEGILADVAAYRQQKEEFARLDAEEADRKRQDAEEDEAGFQQMLKLQQDYHAESERMAKERRGVVTGLFTDMAQNLLGVFSGIQQNAIVAADNEYQARKERIEANITDEEERTKALEHLDEQYSKKRSELRKKQATADKLSAIFQIGINTAAAVVKALPNLVLSGLIGAIGAAQTAVVAAAPIPAAEKGAYLKGTKSGQLIFAGENNKDEMVLPMETGFPKLIDGIVSGLMRVVSPLLAPRPVVAGAAGGGMSQSVTYVTNYNAGMVVSTKPELKELYRNMRPEIESERTREGG